MIFDRTSYHMNQKFHLFNFILNNNLIKLDFIVCLENYQDFYLPILYYLQLVLIGLELFISLLNYFSYEIIYNIYFYILY
jgi:hypothetical protein